MNIEQLYNTQKDQTIYVIGSGSSLNFVPRNFFDDKITVGVNATHYEFKKLTYLFAHHREDAQAAIDNGFNVVAAEYNRCDRADGLNILNGSHCLYRHPQQPTTLVMDMSPADNDLKDTLCVGSNTVTSAMDFAGRILGASAVILCGVDSGTIDGRWNYHDYNGGVEVNWEEQQTRGGTGFPHVRAQLSLIKTVADMLRARGVFVGSLNPFVDLGMEGHVFAR